MDKILLKRERYLSKIRPFYDVDLIKVLTGSRRSGKSKILELIKIELLSKGVLEKDILYINFEDLSFNSIKNYEDLNDYVLKHKGSNKQYLFFDEIQNIEGFEKALNSFRSSFDCSIFVTGSNSKFMSSDISSLLTGRIIEFSIYPFSFSESEEYRQAISNVVDDSFFDYLQFGGYPLRFNLTDVDSIRAYLNELYQNICQKDILTRDGEIEKAKFYKITSYILKNAGNEFNPISIYNFLKTENKGKEFCSLKTIYNYLDKLEKAFLIKPIYKYNLSGKTELKSHPKYYAVDNGFIFIQNNSLFVDKGRYLENIVCIELLSRGYSLFVGKTYKSEVDFIAIKNGKKCFIQVAYLLDNETTLQREFDAFKPIKDSSPKYVLSLDKTNFSREGIIHYNLIDFLLNKVDLFLS